MMCAVATALEFCHKNPIIISAAHAAMLSLLHPHQVKVICDSSGSALIAFIKAWASVLESSDSSD